MSTDGFSAFVGNVAPAVRRGFLELKRLIAAINARPLVEFETSSYTPTLTGMVIGTGGTPINTASYTFVGDSAVGASGLLVIDGIITFGTAGQTFPSSPTISLPAGFSFDATTFPGSYVGAARLLDSSLNAPYASWVRMANATAVRLLRGVEAEALPSTTTPFTWASGDRIVWHVAMQVVRV